MNNHHISYSFSDHFLYTSDSELHTVAANKKFPFRFRGTPVQRLAVDKKTVIRQYSPWARHVVLQYYQNFAEHDVDRWLANSGTKTP